MPAVRALNPAELTKLLGAAVNGAAAPLALELFPRGPWVEELGFEDSEFLNQVRPMRGVLQEDDDFLHDLYLRV